MSFFDSVKNFFGVGAPKITIIAPQFEAGSKQVKVEVKLMGNDSQQNIDNPQIEIRYRRNEEERQLNGTIRTHRTNLVIGQATEQSFVLGPKQEHTLTFMVPYALPEEALKKDGLAGGVDKLVKMAKKTKEKLQIKFRADNDQYKSVRKQIYVPVPKH